MSKTFTVTRHVIYTETIEVEANSEEEAIDTAERLQIDNDKLEFLTIDNYNATTD